MLFRTDSRLCIECAKLLTKMGQSAKAITMLQRALDIDAYNPYTYQCIAKLEIKLGNYSEARRMFATGAAMAEEGLSVCLGSEGDARLRDVLSGNAGADTGTDVTKARPRRTLGAGAAGLKSERLLPGSGAGRRELAALLHEWATFADSQGDDVNSTRAIFQKAVDLDAQRVGSPPSPSLSLPPSLMLPISGACACFRSRAMNSHEFPLRYRMAARCAGNECSCFLFPLSSSVALGARVGCLAMKVAL